ncbi:hypothetical protein BGZ65_000165, partial [Modicella reniformis]
MTYERKRDCGAAEWEPPNEDDQQELAPEQVPELPHEQVSELPHEQEPELPHEKTPEIPHEQAPGIVPEQVPPDIMNPEEEEELVRKFDRLSEYFEVFKGKALPAAAKRPLSDLLSVFEQTPQPIEWHTRKRPRQQRYARQRGTG